MRASKAKWISDILANRLKRGAYNSVLPGVPALAKEFGVSQMTVNSALKMLKAANLATALENGRLVRSGMNSENKSLRVVELRPSGVYPFDRWSRAIRESAAGFGCNLRVVTFQYPDDPEVFSTINQDDFDVIFMHNYQNLIAMPLVSSRVYEISNKVVSLFHDDTKNGIRMLDGYESKAIIPLIDHMLSSGCRKIGLLCNGHNMRRGGRNDLAIRHLKKCGACGSVVHITIPPFSHTANAVLSELRPMLAEGVFSECDGIICSNVNMVIGLSCALRERGLRIPEDVSLASFGNPELAMLQNPPLTVVNTPDPRPLVDEILKQYLGASDTPERLKFISEVPENDPGSVLFYGKSIKNNS
jgi:DNA-binding LacI/PurR family transcriptional regulator